jgi:hypothetical protein
MHPLIRGNLLSRTSRTGLVLILIGAAEQALPQIVGDLISDRYEGAVLALIGAVVIFLRNITSQSIPEKGGAQ